MLQVFVIWTNIVWPNDYPILLQFIFLKSTDYLDQLFCGYNTNSIQ